MIIFTETGFLVMFLAHIVADFYCQSDKMAENCRKDLKGVKIHSAVYAAVIPFVLLLGYPPTWTLAELWAGMSIAHFLIDALKYCFCCRWLPDHLTKKQVAELDSEMQKYSFAVFAVDQCLHLVLLIVFWYWLGVKLNLREYVTWNAEHLPVLPIQMILSVALVLRPTGIMIQKLMLHRKTSPQPDKSEQSYYRWRKVVRKTNVQPDRPESDREYYLWRKESAKPEGSAQDDPGAGKWIGYLERLIILLLVMYHQYSAIAFVLTAKSVARFKAIEDNRITAEYYLIGTLMSAAATLVIAVLLGICGNGA